MKHKAVMLMLCVTIPTVPITARVKMDLLEMENIAPVTMKIEEI